MLRRLAAKGKYSQDYSETLYRCKVGVDMLNSEIKNYGPHANFGDRAPSMLAIGEIFAIFVNVRYCYQTNRKSLNRRFVDPVADETMSS